MAQLVEPAHRSSPSGVAPSCGTLQSLAAEASDFTVGWVAGARLMNSANECARNW
jgi:hypothetical protein